MQKSYNRDEFQSNIDTYRGFYEAYEVGLFLDMLSRQFPLYEKLNFNSSDGTYKLDRDMVERALRFSYGKSFAQYQGNYYGLVLFGTFKLLFTEGFEIIGNKKQGDQMKKLLSDKMGKELFDSYYEIFRFLRNFWVHNSDPKFRIQESHYSMQKKQILKKTNEFPGGIASFKYAKNQISDFTFLWDIDISIGFNSLSEGLDIRSICSFDEMMQLLRLFYNFCSLCDASTID